ncbi:NADH dehydrogenase [ubiquinone] 1 beta subcomplex subunit 7 [Schistocerca americana]|uniref:NADH dehydrogenase [ubiquinone] 1 beta subcomplex subunit 7 n=1 Tax=Schistocerca americana TaxID=7009 RepID=UPI001F4F1DCD|nr:NADH dehydrogenase [ubiquinone] 1 beta subcomplex subunit 7 [Schistocerca americana]XP_047113508.1 NADH dehydrogenase [ubiquinone] 1 beta subcomplex subunit 7 [Schistocerca piceifrons]XP_049778454.1 NADH dehydrogenase [ubiquinone] 1 beta subcomplex subunit 7 [Schistocerca cancellata]XP_049859357.1 NADH dehydrogenase [ubiquinone] 1 beta subcomplex subunit 7 [Schistocerca gregaria]XP_049959407.1 NADH dehydrogenase [ubiquinone] 1 beta subcomplex subunit 7 [Schistocerca serialis cubense]
MGNAWALYVSDPQGTPQPMKEPSFDPLLGFPNGRKQRVMLATEEEMISAKIPPENRDYCAHLLIKYQACRADVWPWAYKCAHEKHAYMTCEFEDYVLRMKEYERERRLLQRQKRIAAKSHKEELEE